MRRILPVLILLGSSPMAALVVLVAVDPGGRTPGGGGPGEHSLMGPVALAASAVAAGGLLAALLAVSLMSRRIGRAEERALGGRGRWASRAERNRRRLAPVVVVGLVLIGLAWLIAPRVGGAGRASVVSVAVGYQIPALLVGLASVLGQRVLHSGLRATSDRPAERPATTPR